MIAVQFATFVCVLILLCMAVVRLKRTPHAHPDLSARRDTARLTGALTASLGLSLIQSRFLPGSIGALLLSIAAIPFGIAALWLLVRLITAYRREKAHPTDKDLPDISTLQSRISPPSDGTKRG